MRNLYLCLAVVLLGSSAAAHADNLVGRWVTLRSVNFRQNVVQHRGFLGESKPIANDQDRKDGSFRVVPGLAGPGTISFEASNYPGHYLRHQGFRIKLAKSDGSQLFLEDASFKPTAGASGEGTTFRSVNYPEHALRHCAHHLYIDKNDGTNKDCAPDPKVFAADTSFLVEPAAIGKRVALSALTYADRFVRHCGFNGFIDNNQGNGACNPSVFKEDTTFLMMPGLDGSGSISFESTSHPGKYLRHQGFRVKLAPNDGSALFAKDASFQQVPGLAGSDVSFRSVNYPDRYIRHCGFQLFIDGNVHKNGACTTDEVIYKQDVTFKIVAR